MMAWSAMRELSMSVTASSMMMFPQFPSLSASAMIAIGVSRRIMFSLIRISDPTTIILRLFAKLAFVTMVSPSLIE